MRRTKCWIAIAVFVACAATSPPAHASASVDHGPIQKLGRGLVNLTTGWLEVPTQIFKTTEHSGAFAGAAIGFGKGLVLGVGRTLVGAIEIVSFPVPNPMTGYRPVIEPEFVTFRDADRW